MPSISASRSPRRIAHRQALHQRLARLLERRLEHTSIVLVVLASAHVTRHCVRRVWVADRNQRARRVLVGPVGGLAQVARVLDHHERVAAFGRMAMVSLGVGDSAMRGHWLGTKPARRGARQSGHQKALPLLPSTASWNRRHAPNVLSGTDMLPVGSRVRIQTVVRTRRGVPSSRAVTIAPSRRRARRRPRCRRPRRRRADRTGTRISSPVS